MLNLPALLNLAWVAIVFVGMISVLVAAHEYGHYLFARLFGMGVEEFAIGFGKRPLVTWMQRFYKVPLLAGQDPQLDRASSGEDVVGSRFSLEGRSDANRIELVEEGGESHLRERTDFTIRPWPLGGFVRIKGMQPEDDGSEVTIPGGFYSKPPIQRFLVLFAGPLFSVLAGIAILIPLFMLHGIAKPVDKPIIGAISTAGPAYKAGLRLGDEVVSVAGQPTATFFDIIKIVRENGGKTIPISYRRDGKLLEANLTPKLDTAPTIVVGADLEPTAERKVQGKIAAQWDERIVRLSFAEATSEALIMPVHAVEGLLNIFTKPREIKDNLGGPGTMIKATSDAVGRGVESVLSLSALLSISVGIFNLLPAPPLDGGQMAIAVAEMIRGGRRLSMKVQVAVQTVGMFFVFALIVTAFAVDIQRFTAPQPASPPTQTR